MSLNTTASSYYYKIDQQFPVAGQDNDTQGFRSNFQNIYQAIYNTDLDLQTQKINTARLNATSDFAFTGTIKRAVILNSGFTAENIAPVNGTIDYSLGSYHKSAVTGDTTFEVTNWPPDGIYGSLRLEVAPVTSSTMIINFSAGSGTLIKDGNDVIPYTSVNNTPIFYDLWSSDNGATVKVKQIANVTTSTGDVTAGVAKVTQAVTNNTNTNYATTEFVHNILPKGVILMWSGSIATVPTGWALCDGNVHSGVTTPNLTNRFIVGADADVSSVAKTTVSGSAVQTGGSADSVVVSHSHSVNDTGHSHFIANTTDAGGTTTTNISSSLTLNRANGAEYHLQGSATAATVGPTSTSTTGISISTQGETGTGKNLPPFYALAYIMKVTGD